MPALLGQGHLVHAFPKPGAVFGEVSVLLNQPHSATVRCLAPSRFHVVRDSLNFLQGHPEYHAWLEQGERALTAEFTPESGVGNPFLHLSMHLALREQVGPLKARLLCDSGVDLDRLNDLRDGLDHLLGQIKALS